MSLRVLPVDAAGRARRAERVARAVWVGVAAILTLALTVQPFGDANAWWHLAMGRLIAAHGLPSAEPFSFLGASHPWIGQGWLFEVLLAGLVGAGGFGLASIACGVAATAGLVLSVTSMSRMLRVPGVWLALGLMGSALVASQFVGVNGTAISVLGVGAVLHVVARWRDGQTGAVWLLPPVFLVWANMGAGFVLGMLILLAALVSTRGAHQPARPAMLVAFAGGVLATFVNPYGPGLYASVITTATDPAITQLSTTFASPDFHSTWLRLFEVEAALVVLCWIAGDGPDVLDALLGIATVALALWSAQFVTLFAVVAAPQL
ncbi:MAG: hypothetical protein JOY80_01810, partial [Candidatus Dormibacteraeota bacterium]|nr:hypothetical protein [Candidatus Dormibacteraeota bacterium]